MSQETSKIPRFCPYCGISTPSLVHFKHCRADEDGLCFLCFRPKGVDPRNPGGENFLGCPIFTGLTCEENQRR